MFPPQPTSRFAFVLHTEGEPFSKMQPKLPPGKRIAVRPNDKLLADSSLPGKRQTFVQQVALPLSLIELGSALLHKVPTKRLAFAGGAKQMPRCYCQIVKELASKRISLS